MSDKFTSRTMTSLAKIGIMEPWELIHNLPHVYDDFTAPFKSISALKKLPHGTAFYAKLILKGVKTSTEIKKEKNLSHEGRDYVRIELSDGVNSSSSIVFGYIDPWLKLKSSSLGKVVHVFGKLSIKGDFTNLDSLQIVPPEDRDKIVARYRGKEKIITPARVADLTKIALIHYVDQAAEEIIDLLNEDETTIIRNCRLPFFSIKQMLMTLHLPATPDDLKKAMESARRLNAYFGIRKALEATERKPAPESAIKVNLDLIKELVSRHPFTPTNDQKRAIWDITQDLSLNTPMDRLLSADVGNGKTLAYGIPAAYVSKQGKNTVILLPTEPLAGQVADNIKTWYPELRLHLATAGFKGKVEQGDILVGTTAVLSWLKNNPDWKVDFAITDEQQKMGTMQREALSSFGTHILEATATPIPRTMAQTIFGNKKVSLIKDCPVVKTISTHLMGNSLEERRSAMTTLTDWVEKGYKVAVIYPLVAEQQAYFYGIDAETLKEAEAIASKMKKAGVVLKSVCSIEDLDPVVGNDIDTEGVTGFVAEIHAEEQANARLQKRVDRYLEENAQRIRFLGSRVDDEMSQKNKTTIMNAASKWEKLFPNRVAVIHGRSKRQEKAEIISYMNKGGADILISTTLIEIGVDVKGLRGLLTVNAENLGAFTLHQLRGRIARDGGNGDFMMMTSCPILELEDTSRERLNLLVKYTSGDDIAMYDMEQRGFGNLAAGGQAQKGFVDGIFPSLKLSPSELENFLTELSRDLKKENDKS